MNREIAKQIFLDADGSELEDKLIDVIFNEIEKEFSSLQKENIRLKKQLSKGHHIEYSCSFCKPVGEKQSCENCNHYNGTQTCNKFVTRGSYNYKDFYYKDFYCNKWELKC